MVRYRVAIFPALPTGEISDEQPFGYNRVFAPASSMSGNQQPPTDGNTNLPSAWVGALSVLFSLALILYGLRMYTRIRPAFVLAAPDYIITVAFVGTCPRRL